MMISFDVLLMTMPEFERGIVEHWIARDWIRPAQQTGSWLFDDIDVARMRLIGELRDDLGLDERALPVVLHLLDQLYDARRGLLRVRSALANDVPDEIRGAMLAALSGPFDEVAASSPAPD